MTVVVGYIPTAEGIAAMEHAIEFAQQDGSRLVVVNTGHHGNNAHPNFATPADLDALEKRLRELGRSPDPPADDGAHRRPGDP